MARKKYIKDERGITRAITTPNLGLEKPLTNENYDVNVFNGNSDKIDSEIKKLKDNASNHTHTKNQITDFSHTHEMNEITGLVLSAKNITVEDLGTLFEATNVEDALKEAMTKSKANETSILNVQSQLGTNIALLSEDILAIREVL